MKRKKRVDFPFLCERQGLIEERMFSVWIKHQIGDERVEPIIKLLRDLGAFKFVNSLDILGTIQIQTGMRMMADGKSKRDDIPEETLKACLEEMAVCDEKIGALKLYEKFYKEILYDEPLFDLN